MSTAIRVISGTVASWAQIGALILTQLVLVPIYLNHWDVSTYGIWLAIQGLMGVLSMLDLGYQNFVGFELLKIGRNDVLALSKTLWSGVAMGIAIGFFQILVIVAFIATGTLPFIFGERQISDELEYAASWALLLQGLSWMLTITIPGLLCRTLAVFGRYPRTVWWSFAHTMLVVPSPLIAVAFGAGLFGAAATQAIASVVYFVIFFGDLLGILKLERVRLVKPAGAIAWTNFIGSIPLIGKTVLENIRQQGVRLLLAPLAGASGLAAFSTLRTGANVALQGLNTVAHPIIPDLMRFLHARDEQRSLAAFSTLWIVVIALMAPGVVLLQVLIEPLYIFWTQGKIPFNAALFAMLSMGVLVYAVIQPAMAIVAGNNLTQVQLVLAIVSAVVVLVAISLLVPLLGISGAGVALLIAEVVVAVGYIRAAKRWLKAKSMNWPKLAFRRALASVALAASALSLIVALPSQKFLILGLSVLLLGWNAWRFWLTLPSVAVNGAKEVLRKIPGIHQLKMLMRKFSLGLKH